MKHLLGIITLVIVSLLPSDSSAQVYFTGGGKMRISGNGKMIVNNPIPGGIVSTAGGGIITEGENAKVVLMVGESTGTYTVPFVTPGGQTIPYTFDVTTPGVGSNGMIVLSSWATDDNKTINTMTGVPPALPQSVSQFFTENTWGNWSVQGGQKVINRFWSISHQGYVTQPKGEYIFTYHLSEKPAPVVESQLTAQRWNDVDETWLDWLYADVANTVNKTVSVLIQNPEDQYTIWTLTDISDPLPIELVRFVGVCTGTEVELSWTTWTETNNELFIIEHSTDGEVWSTVGGIPGAGNSNSPITYTLNTPAVSGTTYYRIKDIDTYGMVSISNVIAVTCGSPVQNELTLFPNPNDGIIYVIGGQIESVHVINTLGQKVSFGIEGNQIDISDLSSGTYMMNINNKNHRIIRR